MLKPKMMLCVMMLPLVVVGCTSKAVCHSVKLPPPPAWIMQPPDWQTPLNGIISPPGERLITMQKQLEGTQKYILMSSADRAFTYRWATHAIIVSTQCASSAEYKCSKVRNRAIHLRMFVACFNNIFCAATNFGRIDSFLLPNSRNEENDG